MWNGLTQPPEGTPRSQFAAIAGNVHAAPSLQHGLGAFASADLEAETVATLYPVHSIGLGAQRISAEDDAEYWRRCTAAYRSTAGALWKLCS